MTRRKQHNAEFKARFSGAQNEPELTCLTIKI